MMRDIIDLRKNKWVPKIVDGKPEVIGEGGNITGTDGDGKNRRKCFQYVYVFPYTYIYIDHAEERPDGDLILCIMVLKFIYVLYKIGSRIRRL